MVPRILLVDDAAETCTFLEELLSRRIANSCSVQDPDTALMKIRQDSFDSLISDINLNAPRSASTCCAVSRQTNTRPRVDQRVWDA